MTEELPEDPIDIVHQSLQKYAGLRLLEVNKSSSFRSDIPEDEIQMLFGSEGGVLEILVKYNGFMDVD